LLVPIGLAYFALYYGVFRGAIARFDIRTPGREELSSVVEGDAPVERGEAFVAALGGAGNLVSIDACTTRLRLVVRDQAKADEVRLRALGAKGFVRPSAQALQVVLGPIADMVADEMRGAVGGPAKSAPVEIAPVSGASPWLDALGGRVNILEVAANPSRLMLRLAEPSRIDEGALRRLGLRAVARPGDGSLHLLLDDAEPIGRALAA
jgi:PTS system N-acetylglucosamine-specific IIC component